MRKLKSGCIAAISLSRVSVILSIKLANLKLQFHLRAARCSVLQLTRKSPFLLLAFSMKTPCRRISRMRVIRLHSGQLICSPNRRNFFGDRMMVPFAVCVLTLHEICHRGVQRQHFMTESHPEIRMGY
jgi:hypothetical protein